VGFLWLNSIFIGMWYNLADARMSNRARWLEGAKVILVAPIAGILESTAGFWAVVQWTRGKRNVTWQPTPKTKAADKGLHAKVVSVPSPVAAPLKDVVSK